VIPSTQRHSCQRPSPFPGAQGSRTQIDRLATLYVGQADGSEGSGQLLALAGGRWSGSGSHRR